MTLSLSPRQVHDASEGRALLRRQPAEQEGLLLLMDRAYKGDETRNPPTGAGFGVHARSGAETEPGCPLGVRPAVVPEAQRGGDAVPEVESIPAGFHLV